MGEILKNVKIPEGETSIFVKNGFKQGFNLFYNLNRGEIGYFGDKDYWQSRGDACGKVVSYDDKNVTINILF